MHRKNRQQVQQDLRRNLAQIDRRYAWEQPVWAEFKTWARNLVFAPKTQALPEQAYSEIVIPIKRAGR